MTRLRYHRVDVFAEVAFGGNPLVVFRDADGIDAEVMQRIAREMNLSEVVFCQRPTEPADVRMRIFTVDRELPFAGHPVVGTHFILGLTKAYALQEGTNHVRAQLGVGVLPAELEVQQGKVQSVLVTQRLPTFGPPLARPELLASALGLPESALGPSPLDARVVDTGVPWLVVPLVDLRAIRSIEVRPPQCRALANLVGTDLIYAFTQETTSPDCAAHARHVWFGPVTPSEDPVTGSAAGCLASYLVNEGVALAAPRAELRIEQGAEVGRAGQVIAEVDVDGTRITRVRIGGRAVHIGDGELFW